MSSKDLKLKTEAAKELIEDVLEKSKEPVIACSFGKNSMVVLDMVRQYVPNVHVLFNNTLVEYPETYEFKKEICKKWKINIVETKPLKTFWQIVDEYGFPLFSRKGHNDATKNCCRYLKEYPLDRILRRYKFDLYFTGLSRHESRLREFSAKKYGKYFYSKRAKHWKCHPIQDWNEEDVWEYHRIYQIPHNKFYDRVCPEGFDMRTGCWCCTIPIKYGKIELLRINYPRLWEMLLRKGLGKIILDAKLGMNVPNYKIEQIMKLRPCFFDRY